MLVLTRTKKQSISIGPNSEVIITILDVQGGRVRIGIQAPENIRIRRGELDLIEDKGGSDGIDGK